MISKHSFPVKSVLRAGAALALAGCLGVPALLAENNGDLQSQVNQALANDAALHGQSVTAAVSNGEVTLSGTVATDQQRQEAETAAASVPGVAGIADHIQVAGEPINQAPPPPDQAAPAAGAQQAPPPPPPDQTERQPYEGNTEQAPEAAPPPVPEAPRAPVTVPAGTLLQIRTSEPLNVTRVKPGTPFDATVASDVYEGNVLAIPRGAVLQGVVATVKQPGRLGGSGELELQLTSVQLAGKSYPVETDMWSSKSPNKAGYTAGNTAAGAIFGAIIGGMIGRGPGAAVGALAGGGAGLMASAATNGPRVVLPPETLLNFHLARAVTVQPVSWQEAQRLASNVPQLQRRPVYYRRPYPYYPPPPPPYPYYYPY